MLFFLAIFFDYIHQQTDGINYILIEKSRMIVEPRRRKSSSVTFSIPDDHYHHQYYGQRTASFAESDLDYG